MHTFADRLNALFDRARIQGDPFSNEDVERRSGGLVSANHVWRLRNGRNLNPGLDTVQALADVFDVALDYFAGRNETSDAAAIRRVLAQPEWRRLVVLLDGAHVNRRDTNRLIAIVTAYLAEDSPTGESVIRC